MALWPCIELVTLLRPSYGSSYIICTVEWVYFPNVGLLLQLARKNFAKLFDKEIIGGAQWYFACRLLKSCWLFWYKICDLWLCIKVKVIDEAHDHDLDMCWWVWKTAKYTKIIEISESLVGVTVSYNYHAITYRKDTTVVSRINVAHEILKGGATYPTEMGLLTQHWILQ